MMEMYSALLLLNWIGSCYGNRCQSLVWSLYPWRKIKSSPFQASADFLFAPLPLLLAPSVFLEPLEEG